LLLLLSPWWFRKTYQPVLGNEALFKVTAYAKAAFGLVFLLLGIFIY
jgi:hypothetical protein